MADEPLRQALLAACSREAPSATILAGGADDPAQAISALSVADIIVVTLALALGGPLAEPIRGCRGRRLLLATDTLGYEIIGLHHTAAASVRATAQAVRAIVGASTPRLREGIAEPMAS